MNPAIAPSADESDASDSADSIFAVSSYRQRPPTPRQFKPWHKPRKQLVREEVWGSEIEWLLKQKQSADNTLKYLGLPGADLLDLRYIYQRFCSDGTYSLKFLGFDEGALPGSDYRDSLNVSLQEVRSLEYVDKGSEVLGDNFRLLADKDSIAWDAAKRLGPFDVINIDLCGQMVNDDPAMDISIYNAIYNLCSLQNRRTAPWILLLTSRVNRESVASAALERLMEAIATNFSSCPDFVRSFQSSLGFGDVSAESLAALGDEGFFATMMTGLAKWLLGLAHDMKARFSVSKTVGYRVYGGAPYLDMASTVYRFEPATVISPDPLGLATAIPVLPSECDQAPDIPVAVSRVLDIDAELRDSPSLYDMFRDHTAELLVQARYDAEAYKVWADAHHS